MKRTKLADRKLPEYTRGEEIFNMVTHIVGAGLSLVMLAAALAVAILHGNAWAVASAAVYGLSLVVMFAVSSVYHGLHVGRGKLVMRIIDHCDIYFTIAGTYTPILLAGLRPVHPTAAWLCFGIEWGLTALAVTLNAIDLKKFEKFSFACYLGMGWCIVMCAKMTIEVMTMRGFLWLIYGGIAFTVGAVLYLCGKKKRYAHSVFHLFVLAGVILQFIGIAGYVL